MALAALRDSHCKKSEVEIAKRLDGVYTTHHLLNLRIDRTAYYMLQEAIDLLDHHIMAELAQIGKVLNAADEETPGTSSGDPDASLPELDQVGKELKAADDEAPGTSSDVPDASLSDLLRKITVNNVDLTKIEGIGPTLAMIIVAEVGTDMSRFPTVKHFASWLGLCPGSKISGGKALSSATRKVPSRAAWAFRMAATCVRRSKSALGDLFRRMAARQGPMMAITTVAHKIARLVYSLLKNGHEYVSGQMGRDEKILYMRQLKRTVSQSTSLGLTLIVPTEEEIERAIQAKLGKQTNDHNKADASTSTAISESQSETVPAAVVKKRGRPRKIQPVLSPA